MEHFPHNTYFDQHVTYLISHPLTSRNQFRLVYKRAKDMLVYARTDFRRPKLEIEYLITIFFYV